MFLVTLELSINFEDRPLSSHETLWGGKRIPSGTITKTIIMKNSSKVIYCRYRIHLNIKTDTSLLLRVMERNCLLYTSDAADE